MSIINDFYRDGYAVFPSVLTISECQKLRARAAEIASQSSSTSTFSTIERPHDSDPEFLKSAESVHVFWEPNSNPSLGLNAVNKIAHTLHRDDSVFSQISQNPAVLSILHELEYTKPVYIQSMFIPKSPLIGGLVRPHQDSTFIRSSPKPCIALWFALEDADEENGALWISPGSHRGPLRQLYHRRGMDLDLETCDHTPYPTNRTTISVSTGACIAFIGGVVHGSPINKSRRSRHAYTLHVVDADSHYHENNWIPFPNAPT